MFLTCMIINGSQSGQGSNTLQRSRLSQPRQPYCINSKTRHPFNKCHVCLGSYNETAQHAKRQHNGAEESSRQQRRGARQGGVQGRATEQGSKAAGQGSRARQQGKAGEQGSRARQGSRAGQQAKFNLQTAAEGEHLSKKNLTFKEFVSIGENQFANGLRG